MHVHVPFGLCLIIMIIWHENNSLAIKMFEKAITIFSIKDIISAAIHASM